MMLRELLSVVTYPHNFMTIKNITILIITLLLFWSGIVIADILVEDDFKFQCTNGCSLTEEVLGFFRYGRSEIYTITVDSGGNFSIDQNDISKFKIDSLGKVGWVGNLLEGDFDLKAVLASTTPCSSGYAYGINSDGLRCVKDCDDSNCGFFSSSGGNRICDYYAGVDRDCKECSTCDGTGLICTINESDDRCPVCTTCSGGGGHCVTIGHNQRDLEGPLTCSGTCQACQTDVIGTYCGSALPATDPGGHCGTSLCYTGFCDGGGACDAYNDGAKHGCSHCKFCNDADVQCEIRPTNYYDSGCGSCKMCNFLGSCVQSSNTHWNKSLFGCIGSASRCYGGTCRTCSGGTYTTLFDDGCGGCAGQGGNACWRQGAHLQNCTDACASYGGCVAEDWNSGHDDCGPLNNWCHCAVCQAMYSDEKYCKGVSLLPEAPYTYWWFLERYCSYRVAPSQGCNDQPILSSGYRLCVCRY